MSNTRRSIRVHPGWYFGGIVLAVPVTAVVTVLLWPQLVGLQRVFPFAQAVSFRMVATLSFGFVLVLLGLLLVPSRRLRGLLAASTAVVAVATVASAGIVLSRGVNTVLEATGSDDSVRVLAWNTLGNEPGSPTIANLALEYRADVVMLPETTRDMGLEIAGLMKAEGRPMWVLSNTGAPGYRAAETTLLVSVELGEYELNESLGDTEKLATVIAEPVSGDGPTLIATHPIAPVHSEMAVWNRDLEWLSTVCRGNTIIAGDFNATIDHLAGLGDVDVPGAQLGACRDAALDAGAAAVGTWPSGRPPLVGTPIDHVMYTSQWQVTGFEVIARSELDGSDHRPVFAELSRTTNHE
ncbi:endonuclease/exonuclease/phosphatase family protein [uncultured Gulosibacter sp.]|uniref:endonuclease/exonuclease/phosphatase family protein n=1 Tax=uncultured Gulosibacter sp. TaxID=1339167 RepID=UPI00288966ED|nr:endonuclease/exonuclease/phosphatase family protein [uncultured Gulosibacter sp.]